MKHGIFKVYVSDIYIDHIKEHVLKESENMYIHMYSVLIFITNMQMWMGLLWKPVKWISYVYNMTNIR